MPRRMSDWFHLKDGFTCFLIDAERNADCLFGDEDRKLRDDLFQSLKECAYSERGQHGIIWSYAGRGKTHLAHHLVHLAKTSADPDLGIELIYVDCPPILSAKAPVSSFFTQLLKSIPAATVKRFAQAYLAKAEKDPALKTRVHKTLGTDGPIYQAIEEGLTVGIPKAIETRLNWLGGEVENEVASNYGGPKQITSESQLARNIGAIGEILQIGEGKSLIFLVDEAERFQTILSGERYAIWLSALRELFRKPPVGLMLFVIAQNRDDVPQILWEQEISSVIGTNNIHELPPFAKQHAESFLRELLAGIIQRNPCPDSLAQLLKDAGESIDTYPFTADAFEEFVVHHTIGTATAIPREIINTLERCARRAMTLDKKLIDQAVLQQVIHGI
jgi:hypothetical protein